LKVLLDTSALAKRYVQEPGSEELEILFLSAVSEVCVSTLALPELAAALSRKVRDSEIGKESAADALKEFERDWRDLFVKIPLTDALAESAASLATHYALKGADAAHLAAALAAAPDLFVVSDQQLFDAAQQAGLTSYDPMAGPYAQ
jgi:predicted nucleic acid-binding protein